MYLDQAIHDERHTRSGDARLVHFWDADSLFFTAFGFRGLRTRDIATNTTLAQALLSAGMLGPVSILSHHRVELFSQLDRRAHDLGDRMGSDSGDLDAFLDSYQREVSQWDEVVADIRRAANTDKLKTTVEALHSLERMDRKTFVLFEATAGTLASRIRRVLTDTRTIEYAAADLPKTKQILGDPRFSMFLEGLMRYRQGPRPNIAADAAALTTLAILNDRARGSSDPVYPRFFTSTKSLRMLYSSEEWARQELRYSLKGDPRRVGTIWRDAYYYILRAMFPALNSTTASSSPGLLPDRPEFDELDGISRELLRAVRTGDRELEKVADEYLLSNGKPLWDVIEDLEDSGRAAVWLRLAREDHAKRWATGIQAIRLLSTHELTREAINRVFEDTTKKMRKEIIGASCHTGLLQAFSSVSGYVGHGLASDGMSRITQLASIRWGVEPSDLADFVGVALDGGVQVSFARLSSVKWLLRSVSRVERACVCLFSVDDYTSARRLIEMVPESKRSAALVAMLLAARIRERRLPSASAVLAMMDECQRSFERLAHRDQAALCVAYGYVAFHLWRRRQEAVVAETPTDEVGWAAWSCGIVETRLSEMDDSLRVFALNHVVYVQTVANLRRLDESTDFVRLKVLAESTGLYRLADTVGHGITLMARRDPLWKENRAAWLIKYKSDLSEADDWLSQAQRSGLPDREVDQHVEFLRATIRDAQAR